VLKLVFSLLLMLFLVQNPTKAKPLNPKKHPIYVQIVNNSKNIDRKYAFKLSNIIHKVSIKYNLPKHIYAAILMQESGYSLDALNIIEAYVDGQKKNVITDFSIAQIHVSNIDRFGFDVHLLMHDLEYAVEAGAIVLASFKRYSKTDPDWWVRYNCGTRGTTQRMTCKIYKNLVRRYL